MVGTSWVVYFVQQTIICFRFYFGFCLFDGRGSGKKFVRKLKISKLVFKRQRYGKRNEQQLTLNVIL